MGELTGRHVLAITGGAFGIIIAVNVTMAVQAVRTFPGLEVQNGYVASQTFDAERRAQEALGWTLVHGYDDGRLWIDLTDAEGQVAPVARIEVLLGRTTEAGDDSHPDFVRTGRVWSAPVDLKPGKWMMQVVATAPDGTPFRQRLDLFVKG